MLKIYLVRTNLCSFIEIRVGRFNLTKLIGIWLNIVLKKNSWQLLRGGCTKLFLRWY